MSLPALAVAGRFLSRLYLQTAAPLEAAGALRLLTDHGEAMEILPGRSGPDGTLVAVLGPGAAHGGERRLWIADWSGTALTAGTVWRFPRPDPAAEACAYVDGVAVEGDLVTVAGWAALWYRPDQRQHIAIHADGRLACTGQAALLRPDLKALHIGDGRYGYTLRLPRGRRDRPLSLLVTVNGRPVEGGAWSVAPDDTARRVAAPTEPGEAAGLLPRAVIDRLDRFAARIEAAVAGAAGGEAAGEIRRAAEAVVAALRRADCGAGAAQPWIPFDLGGAGMPGAGILPLPVPADAGATSANAALAGLLDAARIGIVLLHERGAFMPDRLLAAVGTTAARLGPAAVVTAPARAADDGTADDGTAGAVALDPALQDPALIALPAGVLAAALAAADCPPLVTVADVAAHLGGRGGRILAAAPADPAPDGPLRLAAGGSRPGRWPLALLAVPEGSPWSALDPVLLGLVLERQAVALMAAGFRVEILLAEAAAAALAPALRGRGLTVLARPADAGWTAILRGLPRLPDAVLLLAGGGDSAAALPDDIAGPIPTVAVAHPLEAPAVPLMDAPGADLAAVLAALGVVPRLAWPAAAAACRLEPGGDGGALARLLDPGPLPAAIAAPAPAAAAAAALVLEKGGAVVAEDPGILAALAPLGLAAAAVSPAAVAADPAGAAAAQRAAATAAAGLAALARQRAGQLRTR